MESISHAKDHFRDDFHVFNTRLIRSLDTRNVLLGEPEYVEKELMLVTMSNVKWTPILVYKRRFKNAIRGYPLQGDPFK